jgi:hypothetical protein
MKTGFAGLAGLVAVAVVAVAAGPAIGKTLSQTEFAGWNPVTGLLDYRLAAAGEPETAAGAEALSRPANAAEARADRLREAAMSRFEHDDRKAALKLNKQALRVTRRLPETNWRTVENYDDAGLYYFDAGKWKTAAQHQAVAVLLACSVPYVRNNLPMYVERLGWAYAKYRPREDFAPIAKNPLLLLKDIRLNLRANYDLRRRYFKTFKVKDSPPGNPHRYIYVLREDALPANCYAAPFLAEGQTS